MRIRLIKLTIPFVVLLVIGVFFVGPQLAKAAPVLNTGYFSGASAPWGVLDWNSGSPSVWKGQRVFQAGLPSNANDKTQFINFIKGKLASSNPQDRSGAQFIIQTMRGQPAGAARPVSGDADVVNWEARINMPNISLSWQTVPYTINSGFMHPHTAVTTTSTLNDPTAPVRNGESCVLLSSFNDGLGNIIRRWRCKGSTTYYNDNFYFTESLTNDLSLVFVDNNTGLPVYMLKEDCGNAIGDMPGLPELTPGGSWEYSIDNLTSSIAPTGTDSGGRPIAYVAPGNNVTISTTVRNSLGTVNGDNYANLFRPINDQDNLDATNNLNRVTAGSDNGWNYLPPSPSTSMGYKWENQAGLAPSASRTLSATYQVKPTATSGTRICFYGRVAPASPSIALKDTPASGHLCVEVQAAPPPGNASCQGQTVVIPSTFKSICRSTVSWNGSGLSPGVGETLFVQAWGGENGSAQLLSTSVSGSASFTYENTGISHVVWSIYDDATGAYVDGGDLTPRQFYTCNGWNYAHQTSFSSGGRSITQIPLGSGQSSNPTLPKPGDTVTVSVAILNLSNGGGPNYIICVYPTATSQQYLVNPAGQSWTGGNIPGGSWSPTGSTNWTLKPNIIDGTNVCFWVEHSPISGIGTTITNGGVDRSPFPQCFKVFNQRFDFSDTGTITYSDPAFSPGDDVTVGATFVNDDQLGLNSYNAAPSFAPTNSLQMVTSISGPASIKTGVINNSLSIPWNGQFTSGTGLVVTVDTTAQVGEQVCVTVTLQPQAGYSDFADVRGQGSLTAGNCFTVKDGPYLKVYGNDVWAGVAFKDSSGNCMAGTGDIKALIRSTPPPTIGASVEYAAYASGLIEGFGTANKAPDHSLTFANTPSLGDFKADGNAKCVPDYFSLLLAKAKDGTISSVNSINNNTDGQYYVGNSGTRTLNKMNKISGRITVLVDGDLTITDNVTYDNSKKNSYGTGDNPKVPIIVFVVKGNINIQNKVTQLDGIYISLKNDSLPLDKSGIINTCSDGIDGSSLSINSCDNPLEIYGSFIAANTVYFRRTPGGTNEAATGLNLGRCTNTTFETGGNEEKCAAEIFRFSPEAYLAEPIFDVGGTDPNNLEIQLIKDLPPIF